MSVMLELPIASPGGSHLTKPFCCSVDFDASSPTPHGRLGSGAFAPSERVGLCGIVGRAVVAASAITLLPAEALDVRTRVTLGGRPAYMKSFFAFIGLTALTLGGPVNADGQSPGRPDTRYCIDAAFASPGPTKTCLETEPWDGFRPSRAPQHHPTPPRCTGPCWRRD
jgi:hypothetical protein